MGCFGTVEKPAYTGSSGWLHRLARLVLTLKRVLEMFVISSWHAKVRADRNYKKTPVKKTMKPSKGKGWKKSSLAQLIGSRNVTTSSWGRVRVMRNPYKV
ncbi:hypothetical protein CDL15_Pgr023846 [Punica granatum]|uniref:Uncharacterized protein n=1 Tax=Punica granatum TaxID=22663 RepID=A0A218VYU4_PUNGR|nr:hypothetical protein CDL15_Pgr023846 [Punica granatum]